MSRIRVLAGLAAVAIGTAWWAGALPVAGSAVLTAAPYLLVGLAVVGAARALAPPGALVGPAVLLIAGTVWLLMRNGVISSPEVGGVLSGLVVLGGFAVALSGDSGRWKPRRVLRYFAVVWRPPITLTGEAPVKLAVTAVLGTAVVRLDRVTYPHVANAVEIDLTVLGGRVVLALPPDWTVVPGRILERGLHLDGTFDRTEPVLSAEGLTPPSVVVNVVGLLGSVVLPTRRPRP